MTTANASINLLRPSIAILIRRRVEVNPPNRRQLVTLLDLPPPSISRPT